MTMQETNIEHILAEHPFFEDIDQRYLHMIAEHASFISFEAGRLVFRQGEPARTFYLLGEGRVSLEVFSPTRGPITLMSLQPRDILGWSWLFDPPIWHFDARAIEETRAVAIDGVHLRALCDENCTLGYSVMKHSVNMIEQRLQATMIQLLDMYNV